MVSKSEFYVAGIMSGTSLDGVDIALCHFLRSDRGWIFSIKKAKTYPYPDVWKKQLVGAETSSGIDLMLLHKAYGAYLGELTLGFLKGEERPDFISSHGHTIFHQPARRLTFQLGDGASIAATTGITTISDFRSLDVALGGQGAPLVPVGDELLFGEYDQCLNLGGFANISVNENGFRKAFDICPVNIVLNHLSSKYLGAEYDKDGERGRNGTLNTHLLDKLNRLDYFRQAPPKSLGKEWVLEYMMPLIEAASVSIEDKLRTVYENIAIQLSSVINSLHGMRVLVTGGGAYNKFLLELLQTKTKRQVIVPEREVVDFKEALIFAFLGVLKFLDQFKLLAFLSFKFLRVLCNSVYKFYFGVNRAIGIKKRPLSCFHIAHIVSSP
ncbi:MAG TPA: anhydro-N-acetylmuramic acid kinase, partial [Bacteroidales bacterium]|nr:anhydro-N-acetylmuramic acid kinase [Bacteroidales bacterium]